MVVGAKCRSASRVVSTRFISSGNGWYRLPVRRPASTWQEGIRSRYAANDAAKVVIVSPCTSSTSGRISRRSGGRRSSTRAATPGGRLARRHDLEVVIGAEGEDVEHLVEHVAVLGRDADDALEAVGPRLERGAPPAPS